MNADGALALRSPPDGGPLRGVAAAGGGFGLRRLLAVSLAVTFVVWGVISWPLPRHLFTAIPAAAHPAPANVQAMFSGDHLQYLYYCWLAADMMAGGTPAFHNLYEFYGGTDKACYAADPYYVPCSLVFAAGYWLGGRAFGWNALGFVSLWASLLATWLLARRFTRDDAMAGLAAALALLLPCRWISLFGGSPTGPALVWVPVVFLGLDLAVREGRMAGGWLAGIAIVFANWTDLHVFFFSALFSPAWMLLVLLSREEGDWSWSYWKRVIRALFPFMVLAALAVLSSHVFAWVNQRVTGLPPAESMDERSWDKVERLSPFKGGLFSRKDNGVSNLLYVGFVLPALLVFGGLRAVIVTGPGGSGFFRRFWVLAALAAGILTIVLLALGVHGPGGGLALKFCREYIPYYSLIRQPLKIYCLMPTVLAVALAMTLTALAAGARSRPVRLGLLMAVGAPALLEYGSRVNPTLTRLDKEQGAYAVVAGAMKRMETPSAVLVLPLWPGDSHDTSTYQYYSSLYRLRMVNGYSPMRAHDYVVNVFRRLESLNQGDLTDEQLNLLQTLKVSHIVVHEDQFPEQVSPFPVAFTLKQLLNHPRLKLLKQEGPVWAFSLLPEPVSRPDAAPHWAVFGTARRLEAEGCVGSGGAPSEKGPLVRRGLVVEKDPAAGGREYVRFQESGARLAGEELWVGRAPELRWLVRVRGAGTLTARLSSGAFPLGEAPIPVASREWTWATVPVVRHDRFAPVGLSLELREGAADVDMLLLAAGQWEPPRKPGDFLTIPAPCFFHAGHINRANDSVTIRKTDPMAQIFYGPKLPFEKGRYQIEFLFNTAAREGTLLGRMAAAWEDGGDHRWTDVFAGRPALLDLEQKENLPVHFIFFNLGLADLEIRGVIFKKVE
ncbi:MAG: hypothetical protein HY343_03180 [Lentisphaerae bacterium]|nr:hypothetical protein [Lentisphaerota bacterium]